MGEQNDLNERLQYDSIVPMKTFPRIEPSNTNVYPRNRCRNLKYSMSGCDGFLNVDLRRLCFPSALYLEYRANSLTNLD
jgi:hypothetical protein